MRASLPMYDFPEFRAETDAFWAAVHDALGGNAPATLERENPWIWDVDDLMLSQTCGWPWIMGKAGASCIVARPVLSILGGGRGTYRSAVVVRTGQSGHGGRFVANSAGSLSGWIAARRWLAGQGIAKDAPDLLSGGHRQSVAMVRNGEADIAAIDAVSWHMISQIDAVDGVEVIAWTEEAPALPYICAPGRNIAALQTALAVAINDPAVARFREISGISDIIAASADDYAVLKSWDVPSVV